MIQKIFTIYDSKAKAFLPPFFLPEQGMATRAFADCISSDEHQFGKHPSDFDLFYIGEFDDNAGKLHPFEVRESLGNGVMFLNITDEPDPTEGVTNETAISNDAPVLSSPEGSNSS